jgi:hypothetical protein
MKSMFALAAVVFTLAAPLPMVAETMSTLLPSLTYPEPVTKPTVTTSTKDCAALTVKPAEKSVCALDQ